MPVLFDMHLEMPLQDLHIYIYISLCTTSRNSIDFLELELSIGNLATIVEIKKKNSVELHARIIYFH